MNYKEYLLSKKFYLKGLSTIIRTLKFELRQLAKNREDTYFKYLEVQKYRYEYRHQHIAYCLSKKLKGNIYAKNGKLNNDAINRYKQIESKVRKYNEPNFEYIRQILEKYPDLQEIRNEKIVCSNSE